MCIHTPTATGGACQGFSFRRKGGCLLRGTSHAFEKCVARQARDYWRTGTGSRLGPEGRQGAESEKKGTGTTRPRVAALPAARSCAGRGAAAGRGWCRPGRLREPREPRPGKGEGAGRRGEAGQRRDRLGPAHRPGGCGQV